MEELIPCAAIVAAQRITPTIDTCPRRLQNLRRPTTRDPRPMTHAEAGRLLWRVCLFCFISLPCIERGEKRNIESQREPRTCSGSMYVKSFDFDATRHRLSHCQCPSCFQFPIRELNGSSCGEQHRLHQAIHFTPLQVHESGGAILWSAFWFLCIAFLVPSRLISRLCAPAA
jgi:hypothetical protein